MPGVLGSRSSSPTPAHTPHPCGARCSRAGDIDTRADDSLSYVADPAGTRVTFAAAAGGDDDDDDGDGGAPSGPVGLWALKFPSHEAYRRFVTQLEVRRAPRPRLPPPRLLHV